MAGRRAAANRIRGPQSALTDFLAANNISATQIRSNYARRQRETAEQTNGDNEATAQPSNQRPEQSTENSNRDPQEEASGSSKKRKRSEAKSKAKGKAGKKSKKRHDSDDDDDEDHEDTLGMDMYRKAKPKPGQFENCEICSKRFTVTPYTRNGPDGGLVCTPCGKQLAADEKTNDRKPAAKGGAGRKRRQVESNRLDGLIRVGAKPLQGLCIEKVAQHHTDIEEFGDLPEVLVDRLGQIFSKKRVLDPRTFKLFLRPDMQEIFVHDAANLEEEDFKQIFAIVPNAKKLVLRNAGQFKDSVMAYMLEKSRQVTFFQLYGANLITDKMWQTFFAQYGHKLRTLRLQWLDASFTDETLDTMVANCPNLEQLKLKYCRKLTSAFVPSLQRFKKLTALSLRFSHSPDSQELIPLIQSLGPNLRTLSLENCMEVDDELVDAIRGSCSRLSKFRLSGIENITDAALVSMFSSKRKAKSSTDGTAVPSLVHVDLSSARDMDYNNPDGPLDDPIGLSSSAFKALMMHSGSTLRTLDMASCRHVSHGALCDAFGPRDRAYPELESINVAFCSGVDTAVIRGIFASCPKIKKIIAFGCFKIEDVVVPAGVALIGVPRAQEVIEKVGEAGVDLDKALSFMNGLVAPAAA